MYGHPRYLDNAEYDFRMLRDEWSAGSPGLSRSLRMCQSIARAGRYALFVWGDTAHLAICYSASGWAMAESLRRIPKASHIVSRCTPFFHALGVGNLDAARQIADRASEQCSPAEYEEDFLYFQFLFDLAVRGEAESAARQRLRRCEELLVETYEPRLDAMEALLDRNSELFEEALDGLTSRHTQLYQRLRSSGTHEEEVAADAPFFCEGLALVRLAELRGLTLNAHYPLIPSCARGDLSHDFGEPDSWRNL